jgi:hypothetical protein
VEDISFPTLIPRVCLSSQLPAAPLISVSVVPGNLQAGRVSADVRSPPSVEEVSAFLQSLRRNLHMGLELGLLHYGLFVPNPGGECCIKYIIPLGYVGT